MELSVPYDKKAKNSPDFIIERLTSGAIINHQAFMLKDISDTDFVCLTNVSCFELRYDRMKTVMDKRQDLQAARKDIQKELMMPRY